MGLNPHLINLMSLRERQRLDSLAPTPHPVASDGKSFSEALDETLATTMDPTGVTDRRRLSDMDTRRLYPAGIDAPVRRQMTPADIVSAQRLQQRYVGEFLNEQDLVLAAQRTPDSRYRVNPDEDTTGENETQANVRPIR
ncbi:hypothetical protein FJZ36_11570 [Candidatus Poribacteria bacterium]|nr:hypothetical protein [Candidatus Poribacteria bacterium]